MTFSMHCPESAPHAPHLFIKTWRKSKLLFLRNPDTYPDTWKSPYLCPGITK